MDPREREVLERIEQRRRRPRRKLLEERVTLSHGAGGKASRDMVEALFLPALDNALLAPLGDAALLGVGDDGTRLALSTDAYVVKPLTFPGGDIGELAVNGTINDLAVSGARPLALAAALVVEEGLPIVDLGRYVASMGRAAAAAGIPVATGDTKVVERGKADGLYVCTTGIGLVEHDLSPSSIRSGDRVLVSGPIGDHGMAILVARGDLALEMDLQSDTAALHELTDTFLTAIGADVRCMRDPTRGGVATTLVELAQSAALAIVLDERAIPVRPEVAGACELLGLDPLYVANEGKLVAVVDGDGADAALAILRAHPLGAEAAIIGEVVDEPPGMVLLDTALGGSRVVDMLAGDPLPRIC